LKIFRLKVYCDTMADFEWDYGEENWANNEVYDDAPREEIPMVPIDNNLQSELREPFIQDLHRKFPGGEPATFLETQLEFKDGAWYYKTELAGKDASVKLTGRQGQILARSTIEKAKGGRDFFQALNSEPTRPRLQIPLEPRVVLRQEVEQIEMDVLDGKMDDVELQNEIETVIDNPDAPLTVDDRRELRGVATTLISTSSKIKSADANLAWAKNSREKAERSLKAADSSDKDFWEGEVKRFETQEALYRMTRDTLKHDERSQLDRVKDIFGDKRRSLGEKLRELFKKEGVTIASLATAVGLTIATIALAVTRTITHAVDPTPPQPQPKPEPSFKDKIKEALRKFGTFLLSLAKKSAAALPGLIGSVVSFLFKTAAKAVGFLSEHLLLGLIALVAFAFEVIVRRAKKRT